MEDCMFPVLKNILVLLIKAVTFSLLYQALLFLQTGILKLAKKYQLLY